MTTAELLQEYLQVLARTSFAEGFRLGAAYRPDSINNEAQIQAFDWERLNRVHIASDVESILNPPEAEA